MADEQSGVTLEGPDGDVQVVTTAVGLNNYVFGAGYRVQDGTVEEARAKLAELADSVATAEGDAAPTTSAQSAATPTVPGRSTASQKLDGGSAGTAGGSA